MRIVVTGASGQLGAYLLGRLAADGQHEVVAWSGRERGERCGIPFEPVDLADGLALGLALDRARPDAVLHAAAISSAAEVLRDPACARTVNVEATAALARWSRTRDARLLFVSTDLVFDGTRGNYREDDPASPVLEYGRTKRAAESLVAEADPTALIVRVSLLFGAHRCGRPGFFGQQVARFRAGEVVSAFADEFRTPLHYDDAAVGLIRLLESGASGLFHLGGLERMSRWDLLVRAAGRLGFDPALVRPGLQADAPADEPRPRDVSLDSSRFDALGLRAVRRPIAEIPARDLIEDAAG